MPCQIEGMVNLARRMLGVSAHFGNPPLQVYADDQHLPALRRSMYATAAGLLMFSQSDLQDAVEEPEEANDRSLWIGCQWLERIEQQTKSDLLSCTVFWGKLLEVVIVSHWT